MTEKKTTAARRNLETARAAKKAVAYAKYKSPPPQSTGRLMITPSSSTEVVHWMPKEGDEWSCPDCGARFERSSTGWVALVEK